MACHGITARPAVSEKRLPLAAQGKVCYELKTPDYDGATHVPEVGNQRSMVHVEDVVQAALLAAEKPAAVGQAHVVTDGQVCSTRQMYEWMRGAGQASTGLDYADWYVEGAGKSG